MASVVRMLLKQSLSHSGFFKDCFFLEGLEMTFILFERKDPVSLSSPKKIW